MHQFRRFAARAAGKIDFLDESNAIAASSGIQGNARARDATTDDENIEMFAVQFAEIVHAHR